jgi:hypothetical protein
MMLTVFTPAAAAYWMTAWPTVDPAQFCTSTAPRASGRVASKCLASSGAATDVCGWREGGREKEGALMGVRCGGPSAHAGKAASEKEKRKKKRSDSRA